jgi:hypothetical protein
MLYCRSDVLSALGARSQRRWLSETVGLYERFGTKAFPGSKSCCKRRSSVAVFRAGYPKLCSPRVRNNPWAFLMGWSFIVVFGFGCSIVFYMVVALTSESNHRRQQIPLVRRVWNLHQWRDVAAVDH